MKRYTYEQIKRMKSMRANGYDLAVIASEIGCAISTVLYHTDETQKDKTYKRGKQWGDANPIGYKLRTYRSQRRLSSKCRDFQRREKGHLSSIKTSSFTLEQVLEKFGANPICYLTGKTINMNETETYSFDHILPVAKGGDNSLENLQITLNNANAAKSDMTVDEFLCLCKTVLLHHGYSVEKWRKAE